VNDTNSYRLFIAIAIPDAVKAELGRVQRELHDVLPQNSASWTKLDNLHLTLLFLGDVDVRKVPELEQGFRTAVNGFGELDLLCDRLGVFPDLGFPRVVWAGVHDSEGKLPQLAARVNKAMASLTARPPENAFTGHITLARPKPSKGRASGRLTEFIEAAAARRFGQWRANNVELIRIELSPSGSRYTTLMKVSLRESKQGDNSMGH